jgi:hypothetical protein
VEGLGTLELSINVSARMLEGEEIRAIEVDVAAAALAKPAPEPEYESPSVEPAEEMPEPASSFAEASADRPEPEPATEPQPLATQDVPEKPPSVGDELTPLGGAADEPLGAPLNGQEHDDLRIPELPQEEKILLEEDLNTAVSGPSSSEPALEYDPTLQPLDFDFPETASEEAPKKKGLFGRFKKK